jgi:hypothetical protein
VRNSITIITRTGICRSLAGAGVVRASAKRARQSRRWIWIILCDWRPSLQISGCPQRRAVRRHAPEVIGDIRNFDVEPIIQISERITP